MVARRVAPTTGSSKPTPVPVSEYVRLKVSWAGVWLVKTNDANRATQNAGTRGRTRGMGVLRADTTAGAAGCPARGRRPSAQRRAGPASDGCPKSGENETTIQLTTAFAGSRFDSVRNMPTPRPDSTEDVRNQLDGGANWLS